MVWNLLVSGLLVGSTIVLMDGNPSFPEANQLWRVIEQVGVTVFVCGAAYLVGCRKSGMKPDEAFDISILRGILSTGSPLPEETFRWVYDAVSPTVLLQSTSGGTDVVTSFVAGSPMLPVWAGEIAAPMLGVHARHSLLMVRRWSTNSASW